MWRACTGRSSKVEINKIGWCYNGRKEEQPTTKAATSKQWLAVGPTEKGGYIDSDFATWNARQHEEYAMSIDGDK